MQHCCSICYKIPDQPWSVSSAGGSSVQLFPLQTGCSAVTHGDSTKIYGEKLVFSSQFSVQAENLNAVALNLLWDYVYTSSRPVTMPPLIFVGVFLVPWELTAKAAYLEGRGSEAVREHNIFLKVVRQSKNLLNQGSFLM